MQLISFVLAMVIIITTLAGGMPGSGVLYARAEEWVEESQLSENIVLEDKIFQNKKGGNDEEVMNHLLIILSGIVPK